MTDGARRLESKVNACVMSQVSAPNVAVNGESGHQINLAAPVNSLGSLSQPVEHP